MRLIALLSFYDEPPHALALVVEGLARAGVDHLVAVDGAYALYPDARPASPLEQAGTIAAACRMAGIGLTLHTPTVPWAGNEVEKRSFLFMLGLAAATPGDWFLVIDADEVIREAAENVIRDQLARTNEDAAVIRIDDHATGDEFAARRLFRAQPIRLETNHYTYIADDGRVLFEGNGSKREVPTLDLTHWLIVDHRPGLRPEARQWAKSGYYDARDEHAIERGQCERCDQPATARVPGVWRFPAGKPPEAHMIEVCDEHRCLVEKTNRVVLEARGINPDDFRWRERYAPIPAAAAA